MTVSSSIRSALLITALAVTALALPRAAFAAASDAPTVVVRGDSQVTGGAGGSMTVEFNCVAKANQLLVMETHVLCWIENGPEAQIEQPGVAWATAHGVATLPVSPFRICYSAYSMNVMQETSAPAGGCSSPAGVGGVI